MKIKILLCSDKIFWYNKYLNEIFEVRRESSDRYWVRERGQYGCLNFVMKTDCEVIDEV